MTFICGRAGVCALGAVVAKYMGDKEMLNYYVSSFKEVYLLLYMCDFSLMYTFWEFLHYRAPKYLKLTWKMQMRLLPACMIHNRSQRRNYGEVNNRTQIVENSMNIMI